MSSIQLNIQLSRESLEAIKSAEDIGINTRFGIEKALWLSGQDIHKEFQKEVKAKNKTGIIYFFRTTKGGRLKKHRASAPGETPANRTGTYRKSFDAVVRGEHELSVGVRASYGGFLELGTRRMKPRPGLRNAISASEGHIIRNLSVGIEEAI